MDILNLFGINPLLLAAQVVNFLILLFILKKFLYGPILKVLQQRKETIAQSLENAQEIEKKLDRANEEAERILARSLKEGEKILNESNGAAAQIIEGANKAAKEILKRAVLDSKKFIELERVNLMDQVKDSLSEIVLLSLQKVLGKTVDEKKQKEMIDETIKDLKV